MLPPIVVSSRLSRGNRHLIENILDGALIKSILFIDAAKTRIYSTNFDSSL
jgi:hypothetical protein